MSNGFSPEFVKACLLREGGKCSMECGRMATDANHRLNRKSGGRKDGSGMGNAAAICWECNGQIEDNGDRREEALRRGVKLEEHQDPETTPMWHPFFGQWVILTDAALGLTGITDASLDARTFKVIA